MTVYDIDIDSQCILTAQIEQEQYKLEKDIFQLMEKQRINNNNQKLKGNWINKLLKKW